MSGVAGDWHWIGSGLLLGADAHIEFQFPDGGPTSCVTPRLHVFRLFDEGGDYAGQPNVNIHGPPLTPTGLPIETNVGADGFWQLVEPAYAGPGQAPDCLASGQRYDLAGWTAALAPGWYRPRVAFYEVLPDGTAEYNAGLDKGASTDASLLIETNTGLGYLPLAPVGAPMPPRIPLTLFNDSVGWASNGSRGAVAIEDADIFALGSRRVAQAPFVASRYDPLSGRALTYSLEPFAPTLGYTGFAEAVPQLPTLPLNEAAFGTLSISLTSPNGVEVDLAVEAAVEAIGVSGWTRNAPQAELSFAGPGSTFQLYTRRESLEIRFEQYGQYRATVTGALQTIWGDEIQIAGHYDFWVAEPLDLSLGTFEGTPLEVGDVLSPVVVVEPGVPADIEIVVDHFVDGDVDQHEQFRIVGTANALGYFAAASGWTPGSHGEYRVSVTATYVDPVDGTLWMGTRSASSIVATPDTTLIAHGERNGGLAQIAGDSTLRVWFLNRSFEPACGEVSCFSIGAPEASSVGHYPFFRGDVVWLADLSPIDPSITLEDPQGLLSGLAPHLQPSRACFSAGCVESSDSILLSSHTTRGLAVQQRPEAVDVWAYWYSSAVRPDVSVFHAASEADAEHNQWYGDDSQNCQIGLPCYGAWGRGPLGDVDRLGDEEGDVKLLFGGAVIKTDTTQHFVPYASMAVIIPAARQREDGTFELLDEKGQRICPRYQGAAGGLGTCDPLLRIDGREVDLFITPTGTRPGSGVRGGRSVRLQRSGLADARCRCCHHRDEPFGAGEDVQRSGQRRRLPRRGRQDV